MTYNLRAVLVLSLVQIAGAVPLNSACSTDACGAGQSCRTEAGGSFSCHCKKPHNVWRIGGRAHCEFGCSDANLDACGGPSRVSSLRQLQDGRSVQECVCTCKAPWGGSACDELFLKALPMPPLVTVLLAVLATAAMGYVIFRSNPQARPQDFDKLMSLEAIDQLLDAVAFGATWFQDGFQFANDPHYVYAWAVGLVAVSSAVVFVIEFQQGELFADTSFMIVHILVEDGLQLMLYFLASLSSFSGSAGMPIGIMLGVVQGLIFFIMKTRELLQYDGARVYQGLGAEYNA